MTKIIGLTGKSGAGKGAACAIFQKHGIPCVDTDAVYHKILQSKNACTAELAENFGSGILKRDGSVDRIALRMAIMEHENTQARLHTLNTITHKYIMAKTREIVQSHRETGAPAVVIDAPQLFEAGVEKECDIVLGILSDDAHCIERILERDHIPKQAAVKRLQARHDNSYFKSRCDAVIENNGDLDTLERDICQFLREYQVI